MEEEVPGAIRAESPPETVQPDGWAPATIDQIATETTYGTSARTGSEGAVPVLRMGNIFSGRLDLKALKYLPTSHEEFPSLLLESGDLLFNRTNSAELVGKSAVYQGVPNPCSFASYLIRIRLSKEIDARFIAFCLNSSRGRAWVTSVVSQQVGQANVSGGKLRKCTIPLPPAPEIDRIVAEVERRLSVVENLEAVVDTNLNRAERLRQSILKRAFEGKLVPQDPNDEPASVLLDRIRAERLAAEAASARHVPSRKRRPTRLSH